MTHHDKLGVGDMQERRLTRFCMHWRLQTAECIGLILLLTACTAAQTSRAAKGPGRIYGQVTAKSTGKPVARAQVFLWMLQQGRSAYARTGEDGRYQFADLALGSYHLRVRHSDYVTTTHGGGSPGAWSASLHLTAQKPTQEVNMALERGGSVSGKLTNPEGAPAGGCYVYALRLGRDSKPVQSWSRLRSRTDLMGQYTISGMPSGAYVVAASIPSAIANQYGMERLVAYYGGAFSPMQARKVHIDGEETQTGIDLQIRTSGGLTLSGAVVDSESGLPIPRAKIIVFHRKATRHRIETYTKPDGTYRLDVMGIGPYQIVADARAEGFARESKWVDMTEDSRQETANFRLEMGVSFSGTITTDDGQPVQRRSRIYAYVSPPASKILKRTGHSASNRGGLTYVQVGAQPERIHVDRDLNFSVEAACAGRASMHFSNLPKGYHVSSIKHEDFDLTYGMPEFEPGQDIGGLKVVLSNKYGTVTGRLIHERRNRPAAGWRVWTKWPGTERSSSSPQRTNSRGEFVLKRVPVGKHTLAVSTGSSYALLPISAIVVRANQTSSTKGTLALKPGRGRK